ncbi:SDR family NAD(P)-dependent oxidoreductase [Sphingobium tyrosinilyticum]|uniref:SDR family NAD(P)-dependent oxidoreductase n=1 Tax=Sphingobium tyrosinilyticum TaxID=2715436 RepID=A0ABV9F542_9SPHN
MNVRDIPAIVTGAASGLGLASAEALAAAGARVTLIDRNVDGVAEAADAVGGLGLACDVTDEADAEAAIARAAKAHGPARILVNCAGVAPAARIVGRSGPAPLADFARVIGINLIGTYNMMRLVAAGGAGLDPLEDGERGVIISTASVAAFEGQIGQAAYAASKAGVVGLTMPAAREFAGIGIRVCAIAPGIFETPMMSAMPQEVQDALGRSVPFPPRLGRPREYAQLVMAIIANPMLNGETIRLDGAIRMPPK